MGEDVGGKGDWEGCEWEGTRWERWASRGWQVGRWWRGVVGQGGRFDCVKCVECVECVKCVECLARVELVECEWGWAGAGGCCSGGQDWGACWTGGAGCSSSIRKGRRWEAECTPAPGEPSRRAQGAAQSAAWGGNAGAGAVCAVAAVSGQYAPVCAAAIHAGCGWIPWGAVHLPWQL